MKITFLGTGASGETPGVGRSKRLESSILVKADLNILIDVTRDFARQAKSIQRIDLILLTHGHMDACGGIGQLRSWWKSKSLPPIPVYAHKKVIETIKKAFKNNNHCKFIETQNLQNFNLSKIKISACEIPHSKDQNFPTFAWKIQYKRAVIYASDIAFLTPEFQDFCKGSDCIIIDGATWKRKIFTHLRVDQDLPKICRWPVKKIILTQIGKSATTHEKFIKEVKQICPKAIPAYDGMELSI